ncbi:MAG: HAMP domain-containing protein, partial [Desulfofustis sp.]|nr:HAMP domain-containing protein [Desulfofustis sp.]
MTIVKKLFLGLGTVVLLLIVLAAVVSLNLQSVNDIAKEANQRAKDSVRIQTSAGMADQLYAVFADAYINQDFEHNHATYQAVKTEFEQGLQIIGKLVDTGEERQLVATCHSLASELMESYPQFLTLVKADNHTELRKLDNRLDELRKAYADAMTKLVEALQDEMETSADTLADILQRTKTLVIILSIGAILLGLLVATVIGRSITRPIHRAVEMLRDISEGEGDLTRRLEVSGNDEVGQLARHFNQFVEKL